MRTRIAARWMLSFRDGSHRLVENGACVIDGREIVEEGPDESVGRGERELHFPSGLLTPGLITTHLHASLNVKDVLFVDRARPDIIARNYLNWQAGLRGRTRRRAPTRTTVLFGLGQALRAGATTIVEIGAGGDPLAFVEAVDELGARVYTGPSYRNCVMFSRDDGGIDYDCSHRRGAEGLERAVAFAEEYDGAADGRLRAILCPGHTDTCDRDLLARTASESIERSLPVTIHTAINPSEVHRTLERHRMTPVGLLADIGLLRPEVILGHAVYLSGHSWIPYVPGRDLELLGEAGASVSISSYKYLQMGAVAESVERYLAAGVNVTIGTDCAPSDIVSEMRYAVLANRVAEHRPATKDLQTVFDAATINAAKALGRPDLGRVAVGATADLCVFELGGLHFGATLDPLRSLLTYGTGQDARMVMVDGHIVVSDGRLTTVDEDVLVDDVRREASALWDDVPAWSWRGRDVRDMSPISYEKPD